MGTLGESGSANLLGNQGAEPVNRGQRRRLFGPPVRTLGVRHPSFPLLLIGSLRPCPVSRDGLIAARSPAWPNDVPHGICMALRGPRQMTLEIKYDKGIETTCRVLCISILLSILPKRRMIRGVVMTLFE